MRSFTQRLCAPVLAGLAAFAITAVGQTLWGAMVLANVRFAPQAPFAAMTMPFVLAALVAFLAGRWPAKGAEARRALVPLAPVSGRAWAWSLVAGALAVTAAAALWTVLTSIWRTSPNLLPSTQGLPMITVVPTLIVSIIAAPLSEEIAFRGYAMGLLRRRFSPATALVMTAMLFATVHLTQGLYAPKLVVYFLAGLAFGFVALRTGSLIPAMVVHGLADLTFFTLVWPHDAGRRLIVEGGDQRGFFVALATLAIATPLCLLAFRQLVRTTGVTSRDRPSGATTATMALA